MRIAEEDRLPVVEYVVLESSIDPTLTADGALMCPRVSRNAPA